MQEQLLGHFVNVWFFDLGAQHFCFSIGECLWPTGVGGGRGCVQLLGLHQKQ